MLQPAKRNALLLAFCIMLIGAASIGWYNTASANTYSGTQQTDTLPKREKKARNNEDKTVIKGDLDKTLKKLDEATMKLKEQLEGKDWQKMQLDLQEAMEKLNAEKIQEQIARSLKDIDLQKIKLQTEKELQKIDMEKMQKELEKALAEAKANLDSRKMNAELEHALEQAKKEMAEAKSGGKAPRTRKKEKK